MGEFSKSVALKALQMKREHKSTEEIYATTKMGIVTIRSNLDPESLKEWDSYPDYTRYSMYIDNKEVFYMNLEKGNRAKNRKKLLEEFHKKVRIKGE